ncbi:hypothetical protein M9Y10_007517 [Tritrichomonas musculus]|uniref:mitogen-activated protein kinase kinase n=1 Tax=Tritrichomonas musculus TaxID=1915356 RepID=A0ABR2J1Z1_9EUKA
MIANLSSLQFDLDKFKKIKRLGSGQFGSVYLVENIDDGRLYALKEMEIGGENPETYLNREINIMVRLNHPSIVKFYGYVIKEEEDQVFILMQYAQKGNLSNILKDIQHGDTVPGYDNTVKQKILIGVARGMMHMCKNKLLHRDIKPANIMLDGNFNPLIGDFGLSRKAEADGLNEYTQQVGSPIYMAPEVLDGNNYSEGSDVFSFGIMMYEIITNKSPYWNLKKKEMDTYQAFCNAIINKGERPAFPVDLDITKEMKELIQNCWKKNAPDRPTFEEIFYKLAYDSAEPMSFQNLFEEENHKYYLKEVRQEEIISYVQELIDRENTEQYSIKQSIALLKEQVSSIKQESEIAFDQIRTEINSIKNEVLSSLQISTQASNKPIQPIQLAMKTFEYKDGSHFNGILKYLSRLTGSNIHDNKKIRITTNSMHNDDHHYFFKNKNYYHPKNIVDFDLDNEYKSSDAGSAIICFDFKDMFVQLSNYAIQTTINEKSTAHLKNWVIEVSNDGTTWFEIDRRRNDESLKGPAKLNVFNIQNPNDQFYRYIRLRQIGTSHYISDNCNIFSVCKMDFFGKIKVPQQ